MKKIYTLLFVAFLASNLFSNQASAQCPTANGMLGTPLNLNGFCFVNIQFAIANSNVSIFNASGFVAQGTANASGNVVISYPCSANPLTSIVSLITTPTVQICNKSNFSQPIILPVKLVSFNGKLNSQKKVTLTWKTAYELNSERFDIEKSTDGINFYLIGTSRSGESSFSEKDYSFEDASFSAGGTAFYRLKQVDLDGKTSYSKISYISDKTAGEVALFPNPVLSGSSVAIKGVAASEINYHNIRVANLAGQNISYKITGANTIELPASLKAGIYIVKVKDKAFKLVKE
jgi:hypothetical protein